MALLSGCFGRTAENQDPGLPMLGIVPDLRLELTSPSGGPAAVLRIAVVLAGDGRLPLTIAPALARDAGGAGAVLDLQLRWKDHPGDRPLARGRQTQKLVPWEQAGTGSPEQPLIVYIDVPLESTTGVLARRVTVWGRLIGVDLSSAEGHTGGTMLDLPVTTLETFETPPAGTLAQHLKSGFGRGIFLVAVTAPAERRSSVLEALIEGLPRIGQDARGAALAALLYLTGETNGNDIHRWRTWWAEHSHAQDAR